MSGGADVVESSPPRARRAYRGRRTRDPRPRDWAGVVNRFIVSVPDRLGLVFFWAAVVIAPLLFLHAFNPYLVLVITAVLVLVFWRLAPTPVRADERSVAGTITAIGVVLAWIWINAPYFQQMVSVARDPAVYALRGYWLTHHSSPVMSAAQALQGANGVHGAQAGAAAFPVVHGTIYPQAPSLLPGMYAIAGRIAGLRAMLASDLVIGGVALLLVYALARRLMGPIWALVPMISLAVSMPMIYFSRATYTEPAALIAVIGGLVVLASAFQTRKLTLFTLAGAMIGVSSLARIDGVLAVIGAMLGVGIAASGAVDPVIRRRLRRGVVALAAGGAVTVFAGWYDLTRDSPLYYTSQAPKLRDLLVLYPVVLVAALLFTYLPLDWLRRWLSDHRRGLGRAALAFVLVVCAVMASRPLWWKGHFNKKLIVQSSIAHRQKAQGLPIDGSRSYDEHTINWLAWYFTWPVVILGAVGLALLLVRVVRKRDTAALAIFATFGVVAALYLNDVSITPDQIWASRRMLPVVLPVLVIAAAYPAYRLWRKAPPNWRVLAIPLALVVAVGPALQFRHLFQQGEYSGEFPAVQSMCAAVDRGEAGSTDRLVILAGGPPPTGTWAPALKIICNSTVVSIQNPTPQALAHIKSNWGRKTVTVVTFDLGSVRWTTGAAPPAQYSGSVMVWDQPLTSRPSTAHPVGCTFWAGTLNNNGVLSPLAG